VKFSIDHLSKLALIKINSEEKSEIEKRISALRALLKDLEGIELPEEAIVLVPEGLHEREDIPEQFDSGAILNGFNSVKDRYIKAPRTL
jgi:Asp-tRNA(Asn)/Glu-tRNA(Gln) amidotransferase C subunit